MSRAGVRRHVARRRRGRRRLLAGALLAAACQSPSSELVGIAESPPLDYSVLVTGGAFLQGMSGAGIGTFQSDGAAGEAPAEALGGAPGGAAEDLVREPVRIDDLLQVLRGGSVFQRVETDTDIEHRQWVLQQLRDHSTDPRIGEFLQQARDRGFDLLLVVEQLQDGPIDAHGINGRWPVTLTTWLLLGVGAFIPDHTFESSATLRVTLRDLQTGSVVFDSRTLAGPVDLSLIERSNALGLLLSLVVPPFWVADDAANVGRGVREVTERRLLLSLARELKSEPARQRLRERTVASMALGSDRRLSVDAAESIAAVRLRPLSGAMPEAVARTFEAELLATLRRERGRFLYDAELPRALGGGAVQVLVATITGTISSATFRVAAAP